MDSLDRQKPTFPAFGASERVYSCSTQTPAPAARKDGGGDQVISLSVQPVETSSEYPLMMMRMSSEE